MSQSLSWIDPAALAASLTRAGVELGSRPPVADRSSIGGSSTNVSPVGTGQVPARPAGLPSSQGISPHASAGAAPGAATQTAMQGAAASSEPKPAQPDPEPTTVAAAKASAARASAIENVEVEPFEPPASRLHARLEAFMEWVERQVQCHEIFIVDEEGLVLMERNSDPTLIAVSSYFLNFNERIRSSLGAQSEGSIAIDLAEGQTLHVVQAETRLGAHALGFTISQPLLRKVTESFRASLPIVFRQEPS